MVDRRKLKIARNKTEEKARTEPGTGNKSSIFFSEKRMHSSPNLNRASNFNKQREIKRQRERERAINLNWASDAHRENATTQQDRLSESERARAGRERERERAIQRSSERVGWMGVLKFKERKI